MDRIILHIDMDAFYASVEQLDNPDIRGKPVIVGGTSNRGVVSAASYEARQYGVHSAMPIFQAKNKCPKGIFLPVRMARYKVLSRHVMNILGSFSPLIEQVSIDEAYMDLSGTRRLFGAPEEIGVELKKRIRKETMLSCSVGIAPNKFLAKIASGMNKPDGLTFISPEEVHDFIKNLPIERVPGVGEKTVQTLHEIGTFKLGDVKKLSVQFKSGRADKFSQRILELSKGIDESPVAPYTETKSISSEATFSVDTNDMSALKKQLLIQSEIVGRRLRGKALRGKTITLKIKRSDHKRITRSLTLNESVHSSQSIYKHGLKLLEKIDTSKKYRLVGVGMSNLSVLDKPPNQLNLFEKPESKNDPWENAEKAMDSIKEKFGKEAIKRGGLL
ncbi:DNA polymerase IV [Thermodesulfobacteriota bacterium]